MGLQGKKTPVSPKLLWVFYHSHRNKTKTWGYFVAMKRMDTGKGAGFKVIGFVHIGGYLFSPGISTKFLPSVRNDLSWRYSQLVECLSSKVKALSPIPGII